MMQRLTDRGLSGCVDAEQGRQLRIEGDGVRLRAEALELVKVTRSRCISVSYR
jgi:hypothetical protein